ncbi:MAG: tetratricopeptide repeat protein [SAR324 cluster bacterium]|nr:tetratricopeptide repeat protein [SAR324 cluster bacterium]
MVHVYGRLIIRVFISMMLLSSCSLFIPEAQKAEQTAPTPTPEETVLKHYQEMLEQLQVDYVQLRDDVQQVDQQLAEQTARQMEQQQTLDDHRKQWETTFSLLEKAMEDQLQKLEKSVDSLKKELQEINSTMESSATRKQSTPVQPAPPSEGPAVVEYSLFPEKRKEMAVQNAQKQNAGNLSNGDLVKPMPPPPKKEVVDKTRPAEELPPPVIMAKPLNDSMSMAPEAKQEPFEDPDLNEPESPRELKRINGVKRLYNQGMASIIQRDYDKAIEVFQNFTSQFPDDLDSDNAWYWIGHAWFKLEKLEAAEKAFREILRQYEHRPTSQGYKTPDAIYMLGQIAEQQGQPEKARYYYKQLLERFPDSAAGNNAEKDLQRLERQ